MRRSFSTVTHTPIKVSCSRRLALAFRYQSSNLSDDAEGKDADENEVTSPRRRRGAFERKDSVSDAILQERNDNKRRLLEMRSTLEGGKSCSIFIDQLKLELTDYLTMKIGQLGFGQGRKKLKTAFVTRSRGVQTTNTGAAGEAVHLTSVSQNWPLFKHLLPEIALAGHSNCGKSSLVNALTGLGHKRGPAGVNDRAGWTDQICFYQLGKRPPKITLVDFPGYGFAVATADQKRRWKIMTTDYLSSRAILSCCCVLVDASRGLCMGDKILLKRLHKLSRNWRVVLTKCDLLDSELLEYLVYSVLEDLALLGMFNVEDGLNDAVNSDILKDRLSKVLLVSSSTGAGIQNLWEELLKCAKESSAPLKAKELDYVVREHVLAKLLRRQVHMASLASPLVQKGRLKR